MPTNVDEPRTGGVHLAEFATASVGASSFVACQRALAAGHPASFLGAAGAEESATDGLRLPPPGADRRPRTARRDRDRVACGGRTLARAVGGRAPAA